MFQPFYVRPGWEAPAIWREQHNNIENIGWKDMHAVKRGNMSLVSDRLSIKIYDFSFPVFYSWVEGD